MNCTSGFAQSRLIASWSSRYQRHNIFLVLIALLGSVGVANAQSTSRDNPTRLTSNAISGSVDSDSRGKYYYYSFLASPGEVSITLTVEPGGKANDSDLLNFTAVDFRLFDRNAAEIAGKGVSTANNTGPNQAIARVEVTRRQLMVLGVHVQDGYLHTSVGGKYRIRIEGTVQFGQNENDSEPGSIAAFKSELSKNKSNNSGCLPKEGTLIIKMKDGSKRLIDLAETDTITIVP